VAGPPDCGTPSGPAFALRYNGRNRLQYRKSAPQSIQTMQPYLDFMRHVRDHGNRKDDRTGTGTLSVFGYQMRFDLAQGFPLLTTKKVHTRSIIHELLWFLAGDTNTAYLKANGVSIWDEWADANGDLGPSMAINGGRGRRRTVRTSTRSRTCWRRSAAIRTPGG